MGWFNFFEKDQSREHARQLFDYSHKIFTDTLAIADSLRQKWNLDQSQWFAVLFEYLYLELNLTDRFAFVKLSHEERNTLMSELAELSISSAVDAICHQWPDAEVKRIKEDCLHNYKISLQQWGQYKVLFPEKNEKMGDTVFWEFSKNVTSLVGHEKDPAYIMAANLGAMGVYKDLDAASFIEKMK